MAGIDLGWVSPDLVYIILMLGLWVGVTAAYMPGTGIGEVLGLILIGGSLLLLTQMNTNWTAVLVVILSVVGFLILPFLLPRYAVWAEAGLVLQFFGSLFLFNDAAVSPVLIIALVLLGWAYHHFALLPILKRYRAGDDSEPLSVVGRIGRVTTAINPVGTVNIGGESWTARSDAPLDTGVHVVVTRQEGLQIEVEKTKRDLDDTGTE
jgi:membrane-bound ClpP family serine protease